MCNYDNSDHPPIDIMGINEIFCNALLYMMGQMTFSVVTCTETRRKLKRTFVPFYDFMWKKNLFVLSLHIFDVDYDTILYFLQ